MANRFKFLAKKLPTWHTKYSTDSSALVTFEEAFATNYLNFEPIESDNFIDGTKHLKYCPKVTTTSDPVYTMLNAAVTTGFKDTIDEALVDLGNVAAISGTINTGSTLLKRVEASEGELTITRTNTTLKIGSVSFAASTFVDGVVPLTLLVVLQGGGGGGGATINLETKDGTGGGGGGAVVAMISFKTYSVWKVCAGAGGAGGTDHGTGGTGSTSYIKNTYGSAYAYAYGGVGGGPESDEQTGGAGGQTAVYGNKQHIVGLQQINGGKGGKNSSGQDVAGTTSLWYDDWCSFDTYSHSGGNAGSSSQAGGGGASAGGDGGNGGGTAQDGFSGTGGSGGGGGRWTAFAEKNGGKGGNGFVEIYVSSSND